MHRIAVYNEENQYVQDAISLASEKSPYVSTITLTSSEYSSNSYLVGPSQTQFQQNTQSFLEQFGYLEIYLEFLSANLTKKPVGSDRKTFWGKSKRWVLLMFFWLMVLRSVGTSLLLGEAKRDLLIYFGDLSLFYGRAFDRFYYNLFLVCWGIHAAVMYWILSAEVKHDWIKKFEANWMRSGFRLSSEKEDTIEKNNRLVRSRLNMNRTLNIVIMVTFLLMTGFSTAGIFLHAKTLATEEHLIPFLIWAIINMIWICLSAIINFTSMFHHCLICKAINLRFEDTNDDLNYVIKQSNTDPRAISKLLVKHYVVCDMVVEANRYLKIYLFHFYATFVPLFCMLIYKLFFTSSPFEVKLLRFTCFQPPFRSFMSRHRPLRLPLWLTNPIM